MLQNTGIEAKFGACSREHGREERGDMRIIQPELRRPHAIAIHGDGSRRPHAIAIRSAGSRRPDAIAIRSGGSRLLIALGLGAIVTVAVEVGILAYRRSRAFDPASSSVTPDRTDPTLAVGRRPGVPRRTLQPIRRVERVTMLLPNNAYPQDVRVRHEAESLVAAGHVVEVIAPRHIRQPFRESVNGVEVRRFPAIQSGRPILAALVAEHLVAVVALHVAALRALFRGSTVLHIHNPPDMLFLAGAMFRAARRHVVFDHHDLGPELVAVRLNSPHLVRLARAGERLTFAVASRVLATNDSHADVATDRGRKAPPDVTVVRNGPPASWLRLPMSHRPGPLAFVRIAYLGAVADQDGVDGLARVLAHLRDRTPSIGANLTIIGDGDGRHAVEAELERWGVTGCVTFTGWVAAETVPTLIRDADICVEPAPDSALNRQSTMIKLAEYLALGKPVVAYDLLENRRTVGEAAILVPPGDAEAFAEQIAFLAADPVVRVSLARRARARARTLTWERSEVALLGAYASLGVDNQA
jgi:glycosyltransferase involved in cell wall biosynthesis